MKAVGIFEAKNRLSELVSQVERGETVLLTRNGRPVAELIPHSPNTDRAETAMSWILSRRWKLRGLDIRDLVNQGRRF